VAGILNRIHPVAILAHPVAVAISLRGTPPRPALSGHPKDSLSRYRPLC